MRPRSSEDQYQKRTLETRVPPASCAIVEHSPTDLEHSGAMPNHQAPERQRIPLSLQKQSSSSLSLALTPRHAWRSSAHGRQPFRDAVSQTILYTLLPVRPPGFNFLKKIDA